MGQGRFLDLAAAMAAYDHAQQVPDFVQAETELAAAPDENKPLQMGIGINPVATRRFGAAAAATRSFRNTAPSRC
jgi:hypothetical protein